MTGLIVPLWNWNGGNKQTPERTDRFNRTFMELKFAREEPLEVADKGLIVP